MAQRSGCDLLVVVLHLLSHETVCRALVLRALVGLQAVVGRQAATGAGVVAPVVRSPLPLPELARGVAQLGCDHGWNQHVPLRVQSVLVVGGDTVPVDRDTAQSYILTHCRWRSRVASVFMRRPLYSPAREFSCGA